MAGCYRPGESRSGTGPSSREADFDFGGSAKGSEASALATREQSVLIRAQLEETLRPVLVFEEGKGAITALFCTLVNQGSGMALDIARWCGRAHEHPRIDQRVSSILGPTYMAGITVNKIKARSDWLTIPYRSTDGRVDHTSVSFTDEGLKQVHVPAAFN